ncbi:hypothetical protein P167DRAFT_565057 [Morchella conica CCBAS932]|uniref:Uncharacterized protein n=1 Tax=Morchella conica CCBAS932 TaxID=1392247 RepID=A0A3N4KWF3_9PEZI|nr:hypothetical protein P167DRAFT_565057 [Morchella conica CCBAS932]
MAYIAPSDMRQLLIQPAAAQPSINCNLNLSYCKKPSPVTKNRTTPPGYQPFNHQHEQHLRTIPPMPPRHPIPDDSLPPPQHAPLRAPNRPPQRRRAGLSVPSDYRRERRREPYREQRDTCSWQRCRKEADNNCGGEDDNPHCRDRGRREA